MSLCDMYIIFPEFMFAFCEFFPNRQEDVMHFACILKCYLLTEFAKLISPLICTGTMLFYYKLEYIILEFVFQVANFL